MSYPRTRDRSIPDTNGYMTATYSDGSVSNLGPHVVDRKTEIMNDWVTPNYRYVIAGGGVVNNPCSYVLESIDSVGSSSGHHGNAAGTYYWDITGYATAHQMPSNPDGLWPEIAWVEPNAKSVERAKLEALARIDPSTYSFGEDFGELRETLQFIRHPVDSLLGLTNRHQRLFRKIQRRRWSASARRDLPYTKLGHLAKAKQAIEVYKGETRALAKAYADVWASYSFAAAPLYRSMNDGFEALYTLPDRIRVLGRETAHSRSTEEWSDAWSGLEYHSSTYVWRYFTVTKRWSKSIHATILYEVKNPITDLRDGLGLRPKDFPVTMWQLMPLSFMIDRAYDVSSMMKAVINLGDPRLEILAGSVTEKVEKEFSIRLDSITNLSWPGTTSGETRIEKSFSYNRQPWKPLLRDALPKFDLGGVVNEATKIADALAVVTKKLL